MLKKQLFCADKKRLLTDGYKYNNDNHYQINEVNMKYSKQRELILQTLQQNVVHPSADYIYAILRQSEPNISLATVYRNLNQLAEMNIIRKMTGIDGSTRYDHNTHKHYHFICSKCNKVYDVDYEVSPDLVADIAAQTGLNVESCEIALKGICPECVTKN